MQRSDIILTIGSLVIATFVALGVYHLVASRINETPKQQECTTKPTYKTIAVAKQHIHLGESIRLEVLDFVKWPEEAIHPDFYLESAINTDTFKEYVADRPISPGEPITKSNIVDSKNQGALAALVRPGMRAVSISVDPHSISSGLVVPGDIVDVIVTYNLDDTQKNDVLSQHILCSIRVLALDQRTHEHINEPLNVKAEANQNQPMIPKTATLEVSSPQAELLLTASKVGTISLSLHPANSLMEDKCRPGFLITKKEIKKEPEKVEAKEDEKKQEDKKEEVIIIRGTPSQTSGAKS